MLRVAFLFFLLIGVCYAQTKNSPVFVIGRVISATDSALIKQYFYEGLQQKIKQNTSEAGKYFKQILEIDPANTAALYELGSIYHSQNQEEEAEKYIRDAVTVETDNKWYWLLLADIYKKTGDIDNLILVFNELIRINSLEEDYYYDKANAYFIQSKNAEAEKVYAEIESRFGLSEALVNARQRIYQKQGNSDKATGELQKLISKNPTDIHNYLSLSEVYLKAGNTVKTFETLNKAKEINPANPYVRLALADAYKSEGKSAEAFAELERAFAEPTLNIDAKVQIVLSFFQEFKDAEVRSRTVKLAAIINEVHPTDPKSFSMYGDVLYQDNQLENAKNSYKKALELNNQVYQIWEQLLSIEFQLKQYDILIKDGEEALSLFPNQAPLYFYTALAYSQTHKSEKAISYFKNAASLEVEDKSLLSQIYSALGDIYNSVRKFKDSDQAFDKALQLNMDNAYVLNNYAYYLSLRNENLDKAESMSKRSNKLQPGNASFEDTYAWVLFKQKNYPEAREWIEKALKSNKESSVQWEHYGDILFFLGEKELAIEQWKLAKAKGEKSAILDKKIYERKYVE